MTERCPTCGHALQTWPRDAIIAAVHGWVAENGRAPLATEWQTASPHTPSRTTVASKFGSWAEGMQAAGVEGRLRRVWNRDETIQAIFEWRYRHGQLPTYDGWAKACPARSRPSSRTVQRLFGTWAEALRQAGYLDRDRGLSARARRRSTAGTFA